MKRWIVWGIVVATLIAAVVIQIGTPWSGVDSADAIGSAEKPHVLSTPLFTPKADSNSTLVFASMEDFSFVMNLRRYNAVGTLLSSTNVTLGAKGSIIAFAGANSGAQMHIEIWSPSPNFTMELTYTDPSSVVQKIPYGDMFQPRGIGSGFVALPAAATVCSTRDDGNPTACEGSPLGQRATRSIAIGGLSGVPATAKAITFVARAEKPTANTALTFWPAGAARPKVQQLWLKATDIDTVQATSLLGTGGALAAYNKNGKVNLVLDVIGYYV